ncbi:glycosyltransferase [Actinomycetospora sp. TBRC 11914]|uniref:glycosyltransferase n=1 Tax=Actinomycetospora sp. TBRC 11914 TaxID=2729387 RepID=UPI00145E4067|nr:glycosyltransferase [Actinomycetospora sp. TBRC 11914]NMO93883.1 glycosyltransferase family 4 protein [Actinomycetospora sp. TBRC 11914]
MRIVPNLRSSVVEEMPPGQLLLFTSQIGDSDAALLEGNPSVRPFTWGTLLRALRDPDLELVEVAEPLWLAEWVRAVRYVVLLKLLRPTLPRRRPVAVATYAIENLDVGVRLSLRALDSRPLLSALVRRLVTAAVGMSLRLLDVVVFGTSGACENYRRAFDRPMRHTRWAVLPPRLDACTVCGPVGTAPRDRTVLFLGAPSERKGFDVLLSAWQTARGADRGWRLVVADPDGDGAPDLPPGVSVRTGPSRRTIHELLRTGAVVAMPSVRLRRWREQIGLPLVEGLAHGCRVVTTTETGLADDLRDHPLVTLTTPGDAHSLAEGLRHVMTTEPSGPLTAPAEGYTKRDVVRWWLTAGAIRG